MPKDAADFGDEAEKPVHVLVLIDVPVRFLEVKRIGRGRKNQRNRFIGQATEQIERIPTVRGAAVSRKHWRVFLEPRAFSAAHCLASLMASRMLSLHESAAAAGTSCMMSRRCGSFGRLLNWREAMWRKRHWPVLLNRQAERTWKWSTLYPRVGVPFFELRVFCNSTLMGLLGDALGVKLRTFLHSTTTVLSPI